MVLFGLLTGGAGQKPNRSPSPMLASKPDVPSVWSGPQYVDGDGVLVSSCGSMLLPMLAAALLSMSPVSAKLALNAAKDSRLNSCPSKPFHSSSKSESSAVVAMVLHTVMGGAGHLGRKGDAGSGR